MYAFAQAEKFIPLVEQLEGMSLLCGNVKRLKYKDPSIKQVRINKQKYYKRGKMLGKGAFGQVFEVSVKNKKKLFSFFAWSLILFTT